MRPQGLDMVASHGTAAHLWRQSLANIVLALSVLALTLLCGVLLWLASQVRFVSLGPGIQAARPGEVPQAALEALAFHVVRVHGNVTPEGVPSARAEVKTLMTGPFRLLFDQRMDMQHKLMKEHDIRILTDQLSVARVEKVRAGREPVYRIYVQAVRVLWVGALQLPATSITISLTIVAVISENPDVAGLWIDDMEWPVPNIRDHDIAEAITAQDPHRRHRR